MTKVSPVEPGHYGENDQQRAVRESRDGITVEHDLTDRHLPYRNPEPKFRRQQQAEGEHPDPTSHRRPALRTDATADPSRTENDGDQHERHLAEFGSSRAPAGNHPLGSNNPHRKPGAKNHDKVSSRESKDAHNRSTMLCT